jgi:uncharacterized membrane protein YraQ (UPF0718 family)
LNSINELLFQIKDYFEGTYSLRILEAFFELFIQIIPYLFISIIIHVSLIQFVEKKGININIKNKLLAIFVASFLGMISPMPTYAAIPIGLSLLSFGVPVGTIVAFIIASPLINPSVFFLTITQLGSEIAFARVITTFIISVSAGLFANIFLVELNSKVITKEKKSREKRSFIFEVWRSFLFFGKYFTVAIFISAVVKALVSPELVTQILGKHVEKSLLVAIALGVPFYSCGGAAIPFVEVLGNMGMNKGAILAFFIAGPATKLGTLYVFKSLLGIKMFIYYLILMFAGAYLFGMLYFLF